MHDEPVRKRDETVISWVYIYEQPGADPIADRFVIGRGGQRTSLVPIPDESAAASAWPRRRGWSGRSTGGFPSATSTSP